MLMLAIQLDGLCIHLTQISTKDKYLSVDGKIDASYFSKDLNGDKVLPSISSKAKLYTDTDNVNDLPFYVKGVFGMRDENILLTKLLTQEFTTIKQNKFFMQREDDIVKLLLIESPINCLLQDVINDAQKLGYAINGVGISSGLCITPISIGLFNTL